MDYVAQLEIDVGVLRGPEADPDDAVGVVQALVGLLRPMIQATTFDLEAFVGRMVFGAQFKFSRPVFWALVCSFTLAVPPWTLSLCNFIPRVFLGPAAAMSLLCPVYWILLLNLPIVKLLIRQPQVQLVIAWIAVFLACMTTMIVTKGEDTLAMVFAVFVFCVCFCSVSMFDALPASLRQLACKVVLPVSCACTMFLYVAMAYDWIGLEDVQFSFSGHLNTSAMSLASSALVNIIVLLLANIVTGFGHGGQLASLRSPVEALALRPDEARLVKALHAVQAKYRANPLALVDALRDLLGRAAPPA